MGPEQAPLPVAHRSTLRPAATLLRRQPGFPSHPTSSPRELVQATCSGRRTDQPHEGTAGAVGPPAPADARAQPQEGPPVRGVHGRPREPRGERTVGLLCYTGPGNSCSCAGLGLSAKLFTFLGLSAPAPPSLLCR